MDITIKIHLGRMRTGLGSISLVDSVGEPLMQPAPCLGLADLTAAKENGNPTRDPLRKFGDTPLGLYTGEVLGPAGSDPHALRSYGPGPRILLMPKSGPCVQARENGRRGLLIHGGELNPLLKWWLGMRPTDGCVRVTDETMRALAAKIAARAYDVLLIDVSESA